MDLLDPRTFCGNTTEQLVKKILKSDVGGSSKNLRRERMWYIRWKPTFKKIQLQANR
jgi:hypothetical protein